MGINIKSYSFFFCENMNNKILNSPNLNLPTYPNEPVYIPDMLVAIVALKACDKLHGNKYESTVSSWIEKAKNNVSSVNSE